jgi:hypothetical protein
MKAELGTGTVIPVRLNVVRAGTACHQPAEFSVERLKQHRDGSPPAAARLSLLRTNWSLRVGGFDLVRGNYLPGAARTPPHGSIFLLVFGVCSIMAL